jgi:hypothetical protein
MATRFARGIQEAMRVNANPPQSIGQNSPAAVATMMIAGGMRRAGAAPKRRRVKAANVPRRAAASKPRRAAKRGRPARLVKGSAAAKRYMASIRRKRKR